jgi:lipoyl(octanoyl) transferase
MNTDLSYFGHIVPCGIRDKGVCSLQSLLGERVDEAEVKKRVLHHFSSIFSVEMDMLTQDEFLEKTGIALNSK